MQALISIIFIDSFQFSSFSLDSSVKNLDKVDWIKYLSKKFNSKVLNCMFLSCHVRISE